MNRCWVQVSCLAALLAVGAGCSDSGADTERWSAVPDGSPADAAQEWEADTGAPDGEQPADGSEAAADGEACAPDCGGKACGDDGCGGSCGPCAGRCTQGKCEALCKPDCGSRACGEDGCGSSCGTCSAGSLCSPVGTCDKPAVSGSWTCEASRWSDGVTCDCGCGVMDPDCWAPLGLPASGCGAGETCTPAGGCAATLPEWTVMVYLNGDNDLEYFAEEDLDEMAGAGASAQVQLLVLADTRKTPARTLRFSGGAPEVLLDHGELDLSDWQVLAQFGVWAVQHYPAQRYALIMSDHGSAWRTSGKNPPSKGISSDNSGSIHEMSVARGDLARALSAIGLATGRPLDLVGFDACIMGNWEVAAAVAPYAGWMVASEEKEPGAGWTLGSVLKELYLKPEMDAASLGGLIVDKYHAKSTANDTLAVIELGKVGAVSAELTGLALQIYAAPSSYAAINVARTATLGFNVDPATGDASLKDLGDLAVRLAGDPTLPAALRQQAQAVADRLADAVVVSKSQAPDYAAATGLSLYFPAPDACMNHLYMSGAAAVWSQATSWDELLLDWSTFDCGAWVCSGEYFGGGDGCDCACGAWDPDCDVSLADVFHCAPGQTCEKPGVCAGDPIPLCPQWQCTNSFFGGNDGCDCDCGCRDPDCDDPTEKVIGCLPGQQCDAAGECSGDPIQVCAAWTCDPKYFGAADGCDCACGCWDPDCDIAGAKVWHCQAGEVCLPPDGTCGQAP